MGSFEAILFDCDGTLVDTEPQTGQAIAEIMEEVGFPDTHLSTYWTSGRKWSEITKTLHQLYPGSKSVFDLEERIARRWEELVLGAQPLPGAREALELAGAYFPLALVTSSPSRSIRPLFEAQGLDLLLPPAHWVCAENVGRSKPNPEGFLLASKRLGVAPKHCLAFEDSIAGIQAARAAGMTCIAVLETVADPDRCRELASWSIQNYDELPRHFWRSLSQGVALSRLLPASAQNPTTQGTLRGAHSVA